MSPVRWTTGIGIAVGGVGGTLLALLGGPKAPAPVTSVPAAKSEKAPAAASAAVPAVTAPEPSAPAPTATAASASASAAASASVAAPTASAAPVAAPSPVAGGAPTLEPATTREALLKAEMLCDQKKAFDECERAAQSLEKGSSGPADAEQAKRFRKIALTHLVTQCEGGSPHACFVMAGKYRAGTELAANPSSADALEKRGLELCRNRAAPECPSP